MSQDFRVGVLFGLLMAVAIYFVLFFTSFLLRPWVMAKSSHVHVPISWLVGMKLRGSPAELIVASFIIDAKRGARHSLAMIESTYMAAPNRSQTASELLAAADREAARQATHGSPQQGLGL